MASQRRGGATPNTIKLTFDFRTIEDASKLGAQVVVVDTPPNADKAAREAVKAADLILIPCRPRVFDLHAIETTAGLAGRSRYVLAGATPP